MQLNQDRQNQFYPTPQSLAQKVRQNVRQSIDWHTRVLDPSAGDGALLAPFMRSKEASIGRDSKREAGRNLFAIEIDQDLRYVLGGKGFSVIGTDFLAFHEPQKFDVIVMNPPFNDGDSHVLHAWSLLKDEGELVAILNRETVINAYSKERKLLSVLIDQHGSVEGLGQVFSDASRKTDVEVVLIKLQKPKAPPQKFQGFNGEGFQEDRISDEDFASDPLAKSDYVKTLCDRYKAAEAALIARHEAQKQLSFYVDGVGHCAYYREKEEELSMDSLFCNISLEDQLAAVKLKFWEELFFRSQLTKKATSDFKAKFMDFARSQARMSFNYANCLEVLISVLGNQDNIFKDAIDSLFKVGCSFDKENSVHWEGWQANDSWKWNKKLIIPYAFSWSAKCGFSESYGQFGTRCTNFLDDLDKVLAMISGEPIEVGSATAYRNHINGLAWHARTYEVAYSSWIETSFIKFRIYKKGTIHIEFLDPSLLAEFNRRAAEGKPWMPPSSSYKQPRYRQKQLVAS
jgi:hypothetical protein